VAPLPSRTSSSFLDLLSHDAADSPGIDCCWFLNERLTERFIDQVSVLRVRPKYLYFSLGKRSSLMLAGFDRFLAIPDSRAFA
jgi:hypothetical protein